MGDRKRILVINDSRVLVTAAGRILRNQDYEVITAISAIEGFDKAKEEKPDVIILNVVMPSIDGYEVGRELRQDPETSDIPIIFLSGEVDESYINGGFAVESQEINMAFECDANDFLQKPLAADDLVRSVKNVIWFSKISALA